MTNRRGTVKVIDNRLAAEMVAHKAEPPFRVELRPIKAYDACGFLAAMLQCMKAECG